MAAPSTAADTINPLAGNNGFLVLVEGDATLGPNETDGAIAIGGDLRLAGDHQVYAHGAGGLTVPGEANKTALLVGGEIDFAHSDKNAELKVLSNGYVKIGDVSHASVLERDRNNAPVPTAVVKKNASYTSMPRVVLTAKQPASSVSAPTSLQLSTLFGQFRDRSQLMAALTPNVSATRSGDQLKITLADGVNVLKLTAGDLAGIREFTFQNKPTTARTLIINVDTSTSSHKLTWQVPNFAGIAGADATHVLVNFADATSVTLGKNSATVEGTLYAPFANLVNDSRSNLEGNVVAKAFTHGGDCDGGEIHAFPFDGQVPVVPVTSAPATTAASSAPATSASATTAAPTTAEKTTAAPATSAAPTTAETTSAAPTTATETTTVATTSAAPTTAVETTTVETTTVATTSAAPTTATETTTVETTTAAPTTTAPTTSVVTTAPATSRPAPTTTVATSEPVPTETVVTEEPPTTAPVVAPPTTPQLPTTGASILSWLIVGVAFLALGLGLLIAARRVRV
ncbi:choice-of-anchor A family protein [Luedemannella flava]|uniref:choice-of-anchor A family protein n=1 Tax=Luedemannella flava TaxID=349316 RepID=UPI0031DE75C6